MIKRMILATIRGPSVSGLWIGPFLVHEAYKREGFSVSWRGLGIRHGDDFFELAVWAEQYAARLQEIEDEIWSWGCAGTPG